MLGRCIYTSTTNCKLICPPPPSPPPTSLFSCLMQCEIDPFKFSVIADVRMLKFVAVDGHWVLCFGDVTFFTKLSPFVMYRQYLFSSGVQFIDFNKHIILQVACRTTQERSTQLMNFSPMRILWQRRPFTQNLCSKTRRLLGNKAHLSHLRRKMKNKQLFPLGFC